MLEQQGNSLTFYAFFVASKIGKTGLTVTVDIWEIQKDGTATEIVTGASATEIGDGLYRYLLTSGSVDAEGEYIAAFKTADASVDQQHIPALWVVNRAGIENLDGAISALPDADAVADQVWDEATADHSVAGSFGAWVAGLVAAIWSYTTRILTSTTPESALDDDDPRSLRRGDTMALPFSDLGALTGYVSLDFMVKEAWSDKDTEALIWIRKNASGVDDGLLYLNGAAAADASHGSITIDDAGAGNITVNLEAEDTAELAVATGWFYDVQVVFAASVQTLRSGRFTVLADVTRAVS